MQFAGGLDRHSNRPENEPERHEVEGESMA
jgi:hypothetical protein